MANLKKRACNTVTQACSNKNVMEMVREQLPGFFADMSEEEARSLVTFIDVMSKDREFFKKNSTKADIYDFLIGEKPKHSSDGRARLAITWAINERQGTCNSVFDPADLAISKIRGMEERFLQLFQSTLNEPEERKAAKLELLNGAIKDKIDRGLLSPDGILPLNFEKARDEYHQYDTKKQSGFGRQADKEGLKNRANEKIDDPADTPDADTPSMLVEPVSRGTGGSLPALKLPGTKKPLSSSGISNIDNIDSQASNGSLLDRRVIS